MGRKATLYMILAVIILAFLVGALLFGKITRFSKAEQDKVYAQTQQWEREQEATRPARVWFTKARYVILAVALTLAVVAVVTTGWLFGLRKAATIAPNRQGLFPLLLGRAQGNWALFDPNRSPASVTLIGDGQTKVVHALPSGMEAAQAQITAQAQLVQLTAAAVSGGSGQTEKRARELVTGLVGQTGRLSKPLPAIKRSELEPSHIERLLIEAGELNEVDHEL